MNQAATRALVTGGGGGIGSAICRALSVQGHFVYVHANRGLATAQAIAAEIVSTGGQASAVQFDVTDAGAARSALDQLLEAGPIQILVKNAGIHDDAVLPGMSQQQWHRVIDVSVNGFYNAGCPVVGSRTPPVEEVIRDSDNGLLVDIHSPRDIAERAIAALADRASFAAIRVNARRTIIDQYDLRSICLPAQLRLLTMAARGML
jgi:glycosyltransferase involved in cell wall biosynthesis